MTRLSFQLMSGAEMRSKGVTKRFICKHGKQLILEGIIIPTAWDVKGQPAECSLFTFDEKEYKVDSSQGIGSEILPFIRKKVRVSIRRSPLKQLAEIVILEEIKEINAL